MLKKHTLTFKMILLFLLVSVPALVLSLLAGTMNMKAARKQVIHAEKSTMQLLVSQLNTTLEAIENNCEVLLYGKGAYPALQKNRTDSRYQQSLIWLRDDLAAIIGNYPSVAGMYAYIPHTKDFVAVKNADWLDIDDINGLNDTLDADMAYYSTDVFYGQRDSFIVKALTNPYMEIGYIISMAYMDQLLGGSFTNDEIVEFNVHEKNLRIPLEYTADLDMEKYETFSLPFDHIEMSIHLWIPDMKLSEMISARDRIVGYFSFALIVLLPLFLIAMQKMFIAPMGRLSGAMGQILSGNTSYRIETFSKDREFMEIEQAFNQTLDYNWNLKIQVYEYKLQKEEQQMLNLKLQINPHLLLNSLNTIYSLSENNKNREIKEFSMNLAKYFRYSLQNTEEYVTVASELDFIKSYSKVQKIRYPNAFYIMFDVDDDLMHEKILPLLIQNFVENSAKYALMPGKEIEILVIIKKRDNFLDISICDNGKGIDEDILKKLNAGEMIEDSRGRHIGVWNCRRRLQSFYGEGAVLNISSKLGSGTQVFMHIPCQVSTQAVNGVKINNEYTDY